MKSVRIGSFSRLYFFALGLKTERYSVSFRIQSECGKIRTRKTPNTDTFHIVITVILFYSNNIIKIFLSISWPKFPGQCSMISVTIFWFISKIIVALALPRKFTWMFAVFLDNNMSNNRFFLTDLYLKR